MFEKQVTNLGENFAFEILLEHIKLLKIICNYDHQVINKSPKTFFIFVTAKCLQWIFFVKLDGEVFFNPFCCHISIATERKD